MDTFSSMFFSYFFKWKKFWKVRENEKRQKRGKRDNDNQSARSMSTNLLLSTRDGSSTVHFSSYLVFPSLSQLDIVHCVKAIPPEKERETLRKKYFCCWTLLFCYKKWIFLIKIFFCYSIKQKKQDRNIFARNILCENY